MFFSFYFGWVFFVVVKTSLERLSVVGENAATPFRCEAPEKFCGLRNFPST